MTTLIIKDLSLTAELDAKGMAAISGGSRGLDASHEQLVAMPKSDFMFNAKQMLDQEQNTLVNTGNNSAFMRDIASNVNPYQDGHNSIKFG